MDLENRISLMVELGEYLLSERPEWLAAKTRAYQHNAWFIPDFIEVAVRNIVSRYLQRETLETWLDGYTFPASRKDPKKIGLVMAGNIPLVGFHDFLCCFISGHPFSIKLSSKDPWLIPAILDFLSEKSPSLLKTVETTEMLRGMDAFIATGSNNSARYFDYYFKKYPSLIRRNRTSIAILEGNESPEELDGLADDVFLYFGLGCRNVTQIHVPVNYDFVPLLKAFNKYAWMADHHKYRNNYEYRLSLAILNKQVYMTNDSILMLESPSPFSPIAVLHYSFYQNPDDWIPSDSLENLQGIAGRNYLPFGKSQSPGLSDYADGTDTLKFLESL